MTKLTKTQISALRATRDGGGKLVRLGTMYWCKPGHVVQSGDYVPDQVVTFGTRTINALGALRFLNVTPSEAVITEAGNAALAGNVVKDMELAIAADTREQVKALGHHAKK
jgi:hypothetical protein